MTAKGRPASRVSGTIKPSIGRKLSGLGANVLLLQYGPDRLPAYIQQQCAEMGIRVVNLKLDTIDEICEWNDEGWRCGGGAGRRGQAVAALRGKLDGVGRRVKGFRAFGRWW